MRRAVLAAWASTCLVAHRSAHARDAPFAADTSTDVAPDDTDVAAPGSRFVGLNSSAMPGLLRLSHPSIPELGTAAGLGYGYTEALEGDAGSHRRTLGTAAVAVGLLGWQALGLRLDGRHDSHPDDAQGSDSSAVGDARLSWRAAGGNETLQGGFQLGVWVPGEDAPSFAFDATTFEVQALGAWTSRSRFGLVSNLGFRWDNSAKSADSADQLRQGDRIALGVSDFNALLVGVGALQGLAFGELFAEWSADILIGAGAPSIASSPMRVGAGTRVDLWEGGALEAGIELGLASRPDVSAGAALLPIEPRLAANVGFRHEFGTAEPPTPKQERPPRVGPEPSKLRTLTGRIIDAEGNAVWGARITLSVGRAPPIQTSSNAQGDFRAERVPVGETLVRVEKAGYEPWEFTLGPDSDLAGQPIRLKPQAPEIVSELRGSVRSFGGGGIAASVRVEGTDIILQSQPDGEFKLPLDPGEYRVTIEAPGYASQTRGVRIEVEGVTILNVDLRRQPP